MVLFVAGWTPSSSWSRSLRSLPDGRGGHARRACPAASSSPRQVSTRGGASSSLSDRLGVASEDVVAFGDGLNDHEMLAVGRARRGHGQRRPGDQGGGGRGHGQQRRRRRGHGRGAPACGRATVNRERVTEHEGTSTGRIDAYLVCGGSLARLRLRAARAAEAAGRGRADPGARWPQRLRGRRRRSPRPTSSSATPATCGRPRRRSRRSGRGWRPAAAGSPCTGPTAPSTRRRCTGEGPFTTPRAFPIFADTLGSQFLCHPPIEPYPVTVSPGRRGRSAGRGHRDLRRQRTSCTCASTTGRSSRCWRPAGPGPPGGSPRASWPDDEPRLVMYRRPLGEGCVLYLTLGHCRGHYDMVAPPTDGSCWPTVDRWVVGGARVLRAAAPGPGLGGRTGPPGRIRRGLSTRRELITPVSKPARCSPPWKRACSILRQRSATTRQPGVVGLLRGAVVSEAELEPQRLGAGGDGLVGHGRAGRRRGGRRRPDRGPRAARPGSGRRGARGSRCRRHVGFTRYSR